MRLTIGRKLIGSFMALAVLMITVSGLSYRSLSNIEGSFRDLVDVRVKILTNAERIQAAGLQQNDYMREYFLNGTPASVQRMMEANATVVKIVDETLPLVDKPEDKERFQKLKDLAEDYKLKVNTVMIMPPAEGLREANFSVFPVATQLVLLAESMAQEQIQVMDTDKEVVKNSAAEDKSLSLIISVCAVVISIVGGAVMSYMISIPIRRITKAAKEVASGDLRTQKLNVRSRDEIKELAVAFEEMILQLRSIIGKVEQGSDHLAISSKMLTASAEQTSSATQHITEVAQEVATGSEQQVRGADDSARAMEEMTQGIGRIAESSSAVFEVSISAKHQAEEGNSAAQSAVKQMNQIYTASSRAADSVKKLGERSGEIGEIIEVITGIASQTSLLALNASIEAARAGENGRGFMVVATEVKKLAIQSEEAAKKISELIREVQTDTQAAVKGMVDGMTQAKEGVAVVEAAGQAFTEIRQAINSISAQIEEVSATSEEISAGSEEVAASVEETSRIAKQSADQIQMVAATSEEQLASMQEITSSAATLSSMALELQQAVSKFKL
jgi:methyl-accepting chemotaxis protein